MKRDWQALLDRVEARGVPTHTHRGWVGGDAEVWRNRRDNWMAAKLPYDPSNRAMLEGLRPRRRLGWHAGKKVWVMAPTAFHQLVGDVARQRRYDRVWAHDLVCDLDRCDTRCRGAVYDECVCRCGGAYHSLGQWTRRWKLVGETTLVDSTWRWLHWCVSGTGDELPYEDRRDELLPPG